VKSHPILDAGTASKTSQTSKFLFFLRFFGEYREQAGVAIEDIMSFQCGVRLKRDYAVRIS
jgi:hypothetical protein